MGARQRAKQVLCMVLVLVLVVQLMPTSVLAENGQTPASKSVLAQYAYEPGVNNGRLKTMSYANGDTVGYEYDIFDRVVAERYNSGSDSAWHEYKYDSNGPSSKNLVSKLLT